MTKYLSFIKEPSARILLLIFVANFFYDDPTLYLYKRVFYSLSIYYVVYELIAYYYKVRSDSEALHMPVFYNLYIPLVLLYAITQFSIDIFNPTLKWTTVFNNPYALLSIGPIFLFAIGANTRDIVPLLKVLLIVFGVFVLVSILPIFGKVKYYQGYVCANAFIPIFFISLALKKYRFYAFLLLIIGILFSQLSDYRIIALRIILFGGLYIGLIWFKKVGFIKFLILATACFCLYQFLTNIQDILNLFKDIIGVKSFDDDDTRGFLYEEVLSELNGYEYLIGRGFLGSYFSQYFLMLLTTYREYGDHYDRFTVEVGFLQLILKGGFIWYILYTIPLLYTSLKGIFKEETDTLTYAICIFLFTELLLMFIENIPYFSFQFSMLFFWAGFAFRKMTTNEDIDHNTVVQPG